MTRNTVRTAILTLIALLVCSCGGGPGHLAKLQSELEERNKASAKSGARLELEYGKDAQFRITLTNESGGSLRVIRPSWHYSIALHFFDSTGAELSPEVLEVLTLPRPNEASIALLEAGESLGTTIERKHIQSEFRVPLDCEYVAVTYHPSELSLEPARGMRLDLVESVLWSNPVQWQVMVGTVSKLRDERARATFTCDGDGKKRLELVNGTYATLIWDGEDYLGEA
ncbi:MAG: hypothetical protein HZC36_05170 [Armatimonadetes bacterium]|nr:hypothetical protein [Armatimonadota bacterium]